MKKRVFAVVLALSMLVSCILPIAVSAEAAKDGGGLDFHSITIHYDQPTVVQYKSVTQSESKAQELIPTYSESGKLTYTAGYVFAEPEETRVIRAGDSLGTKGTAYNLYKSAVREGNGYVGNFLAMNCAEWNVESDLYYAKFPSEYSYLFNIHDKDLIQSTDPVSLRGVTEIVDDAGTKNPNIEFGADGYALDVNGGRIDDNGYLLDDHDEWYTYNSQGVKERLELFKVSLDEVVPMSRYDKDGRIIKISQYEGAMVYIVDENGNIALDAQGNQRRGTPALGTPKMKTHITSITVEIDALGSQLYSDKTSDPQQNNTITVSIGNCQKNIETIPGCGSVLGIAKSVTTRTSVNWDKKTAGDTVVGVPLEMTQEQLDAISPNSGNIFVEFSINTIQGEDAFSKKYMMQNDYNAGIKHQDLNALTEEDAPNYATPVPQDAGSEGFFGSTLFWILVGAVALLALAAVAIFVVIPIIKKKSKKQEATNTESQQTYTDEYGNQYYYDAASQQYYPVNAAQESGYTMEENNQYITDENGNTFYMDENGAYYFFDTTTEQWVPCDNQSEAAAETTAATETEQSEDNHYITDEAGNTFYVDDNGAYYYYDAATEQWIPCDTQEETAPAEEAAADTQNEDNHYVTDENGNTFYVDDNGVYYYYDAVTEQWYPCETAQTEEVAQPAEEAAQATEETAPVEDNHYITDEAGNTFYVDDNGAYYYLDPASNQWVPCDTQTEETTAQEQPQQTYQEAPAQEQPQPEYQQPYADPYAQQAQPQYQQPYADPYAQQAQPQYQQPYADPYAQQAQPQYQQPMYGQPMYQQPVYGQPMYQQPMYGQPMYQQPMYGQPMYQQPVYGQPQYQQPMYGQPQYQQPMYGQPQYQQPMYGQPQYQQPYADPYAQQAPNYGYAQQQPQYYNGYVENGYVYQNGQWYPVQ